MKNVNKVFTALGVGLGAGIVLGVLFAPRKGKDTRELLARKGNKVADVVKDGIKDGRHNFNNLKDRLRENIAQVNKKIEEVTS